MKIVVVGNLAKRTEIGKKKKITVLGGSYFAAVQAARLKHSVTLISRVPSNFPKEWLKKIKSEGIELIKQPAWKITDYEVKYFKDGTKKVIIHSDAGPIVSVPKIECDIALITSYIGYIGIDVLKNLKTEENLLVLDAQSFVKYRTPNGELKYVPWLEKEAYLKYVNILKTNATELYYLTGKVTLNSAFDLLKLGPKVVVLTFGLKGSYVFSEKKYNKIPVFEPKRFVDKSGVGDVFTSAFSIKYKETENIIEAGYFGAAAASYCVEKTGSKGIADLDKINKRFKILKKIFLV